ncbi:hypothetical protein [Oxynema aestuarii]|jgi:hypothetical protein|uniref:Uncharacterized protein n=1 Tax=Oxynema aestuarii AP17 TaxID=2064643 RepID=A0A6H1U4H2_9CYAN|nr:hypothetical protein [Oxynema aestuarii]QIZ73267.1 hypothetical protein HCG48_23905 [Oxynema aestuarii AP17]RMH76128.1 MAG: hypothetical protein D6680_09685 [Cyanobacteria bacterium J007]
MLSQTYYLVRSKVDGQYLTANPDRPSEQVNKISYLLLFSEHFDALTYLNKYGEDLRDRLAVESIPGSQLPGLLKRWSYSGIAIVRDPLLPQVEFLEMT